MATDSDVLAFVRQQLAQFGVHGLSEEELKEYASGAYSGLWGEVTLSE